MLSLERHQPKSAPNNTLLLSLSVNCYHFNIPLQHRLSKKCGNTDLHRPFCTLSGLDKGLQQLSSAAQSGERLRGCPYEYCLETIVCVVTDACRSGLGNVSLQLSPLFFSSSSRIRISPLCSGYPHWKRHGETRGRAATRMRAASL